MLQIKKLVVAALFSKPLSVITFAALTYHVATSSAKKLLVISVYCDEYSISGTDT